MPLKIQDQEMQRRNFLKWGGASLLSLPLITKTKLAFGQSVNRWKKNYWEGPESGKYCVHKSVYDGQTDQGYIWARIDGWWKKFNIREFDDTFWEWSLAERMESFKARIAGTHTPTPAGPHTPSVATYGNRIGRGDSRFHINNKVVGAHFVPRNEYIKDVNDTMLEVIESGADFTARMEHLKEIHEQDIWRKDMHVGIEYFTNRDFETHTFLNLMENPVATLCFQGCYDIYTSFELRCIPQIVHLRNPNIPPALFEIGRFPFMMMALFHGDPPESSLEMPAVIYHNVEEFNNSMAEHGTRVVKRMKEMIKNFFA